MARYLGPPVTLTERVRTFVAEARGTTSGGIGPQVSAFVHRSAPYTPGEASRGPSIFPTPGSTNSNFPPGYRGSLPSTSGHVVALPSRLTSGDLAAANARAEAAATFARAQAAVGIKRLVFPTPFQRTPPVAVSPPSATTGGWSGAPLPNNVVGKLQRLFGGG
jgi:hypothetical protein